MDYINFDANAGHTLLSSVRSFLADFDGAARNPSSVHRGGQAARVLIEEARDRVSTLLRLPPSYRVVFTSGATEANNLAFYLATCGHAAGTILTTAVEHPCVLASADHAAGHGFQIRSLTVQRNGTLTPLPQDIGSELRFASLMLANNETGHCFPVEALARAIRSKAPHCVLHSDVVAALGKMAIAPAELRLDMATISGHKVGALTGVGALIVDTTRVQCRSLLRGGPQELRWRAGTENVLGIASLGVAAKEIHERQDEIMKRLSRQRRMVLQMLEELLPDTIVHHAANGAIDSTISVRVTGCPADDLVVAADTRGLHISSGAACASGKPESSHVLRGMGFDDTHASETIRISLELFMDDSVVERGMEILAECVATMRGAQ
ncbi:MAG: aminotransferase class V-fold PLP-dependent enzyme [Bdellovibrionota bacterium]|nr:MAG: aminotransferase class V-fold PLP-dependent enzyme [Bdellovibrionota bacterium]